MRGIRGLNFIATRNVSYKIGHKTKILPLDNGFDFQGIQKSEVKTNLEKRREF